MKPVTLASARGGLSALRDRIEAGEPVVIMRRNRVVAEVRPDRGSKARAVDLARGQFRMSDDCDAPLLRSIPGDFDDD
jgi:antitoxin (DNA-binding transcriptional repressor) of toxin-antitoxin stability system